jgi:hypothetical protein
VDKIKMSGSDILEKIVVEISRDKKTGTGTGFYISEDEVATCYHVLVPEGAKLKRTYWIKHDTWGEVWKKATPIREKCRVSHDDIAILRCEQKFVNTFDRVAF